MQESDFTEEEAAAKLIELGFDVVKVSDLACRGWTVLFRPEYEDWALLEIHEHTVDGTTSTMTLDVDKSLAGIIVKQLRYLDREGRLA